MPRLLILLVCLVLFWPSSQAQQKPLSSEQKQFSREVTRHFHTIDSMVEQGSFDNLDSANDWLIGFLAQQRATIHALPDTFNYDLLYIVHSKDRRLTLVSWDTRKGGTMIEFTTLAIYSSAKSLVAIMLLDPEYPAQPETFVHYNNITTVVTAQGKAIYLAWGNGQGSTLVPWQELQAFSITGNLNMPTIFPDNSSSLFVSFDLDKIGDIKYLPTIEVSKDGRTVDVPLTDDEDRFQGNFQRYMFNGQRFTKKGIIKKS